MVTLDGVDRVLGSGSTLGFRKRETRHADCLGWILVRKLRHNPRILELFTVEEAPAVVDEELRKRDEPYQVLDMELIRAVHESDAYEGPSDYRLVEEHRFSTIQAVARMLDGLGYDLLEARDSREIDAP